MSRAKYIVVDSLTPFGVAFPPWVNHAEVAHKFVETSDLKERILGAGEFSVGRNERGEPEVSCFGKSVSLDIKSRGEEDALVLKATIFGV